MVNPGALESVLLIKLQLTLKLSQLMLEVEPGLLGEVETLLRADDDASESKTKLAAKIQCSRKHAISGWLDGTSLPYSRIVHPDCSRRLNRRRNFRRMPEWTPPLEQWRELPGYQEHSSPLEVAVALPDPKSVGHF
jgi:hypothetical protein